MSRSRRFNRMKASTLLVSIVLNSASKSSSSSCAGRNWSGVKSVAPDLRRASASIPTMWPVRRQKTG